MQKKSTGDPTTPAEVQVLPHPDALSHAAAACVVDAVMTILATQARCTISLAGGSTPRRLYERLAQDYQARLPWERLYLFWSDERYVPPAHTASNYRMAYEALLQHVPLPGNHVFPIPTEAHTPEAAATAYAATLRPFFDATDPAFDVTLLGLGTDGHTASLFPEDAPWEALSATDTRRVEAVVAPPRYDIRPRITLTLPALNASQRVFFLVSGAPKREVLRAVLHDADPDLPATYVRARKQVTWLVDEAAFS